MVNPKEVSYKMKPIEYVLAFSIGFLVRVEKLAMFALEKLPLIPSHKREDIHYQRKDGGGGLGESIRIIKRRENWK